jgi:hypothetical protein
MGLEKINETLVDIFDIGAEPVTDLVASVFLEGVIGALVPGVVSTMMAYKQKRAENNYITFMKQVAQRQTELEEKLKAMQEDNLNWYKRVAFPLVSDFVLECTQEDKIEYLVNGFINLADMNNSTESLILYYYEVLDRLSMLDLVVLKNKHIFYKEPDNPYLELLKSESYFDGTYEMINYKLESLGLIQTIGAKEYDKLLESVEEIYKYLENLSKNKKAKIPSRTKVVRSSRSNNYQITNMGNRFLRFFCTK